MHAAIGNLQNFPMSLASVEIPTVPSHAVSIFHVISGTDKLV